MNCDYPTITVRRRDKMHNKYAGTWGLKMTLRVRATNNNGSEKQRVTVKGKCQWFPWP